MRRILRVVKATVVLSIVFLMTVDTANACRFLRLLFAHHGKACCPTVACDDCSSAGSAPVVSSPIVSAPIVSTPIVSAPIAAPVISAPIVSDYVVSGPVVADYVSAPLAANNCCCCDGGIIESAPVVNSFVPTEVVDDGYVEGGFVEGGYPVESYPADGAMIESYDQGQIIDGQVIEGDMYQPTPMEVLPSEGTVISPADAGSVVAPIPTPEDTLPSTDPPPADSPLDSAVDPPADAGGDDPLFAPEQAEGAGAGGGVDEGFGADLGGQADPLTDGGDAFTEDPAPVEENNGGAFAEDTAPVEEDNLFGGGDPAPIDDTPADMPTDDNMFSDPAPAGDMPEDDLFDTGGDDAPLDEGDDLFSPTSVSEPSDTITTSTESGDADELFDEPSSNPIDDALPGDEPLLDAPLEDTPVEDDLDGLFGSKKNAAEGMRVWTDNTGRYKTVGQLVVIAKTHVRLLKENGRYSTVPLNRLSNGDLDYVMAVAKRLSDAKGLASL